MSVPFVLSTRGWAEIPLSAERAVVNVAVASQGTNKASVSDDVVTTAQHVERLLRELSPVEDTPEAKATASLAHWSKTGLSATSFQPNSSEDHSPPRQYTARITFDIRFQKFKELGAFGPRLAALPHTEISHIDWILKAATHKAHQSQLRQTAARDALEKARDYCDVLGCGVPRAVELNEVSVPSSGEGASLFGGARGFVSASRAHPVAYQYMQLPRGMSAPIDGRSDERDESPLEFTPKEVRLTMEVTVKFHAE